MKKPKNPPFTKNEPRNSRRRNIFVIISLLQKKIKISKEELK